MFASSSTRLAIATQQISTSAIVMCTGVRRGLIYLLQHDVCVIPPTICCPLPPFSSHAFISMPLLTQYKSFHHLPSLKEVSGFKDKSYVTFPVVILALKQCSSTGILLVTDFSSHAELGYAINPPAKFLPRVYKIGTKALRGTEIISVAVHISKTAQVWHSLQKFGSLMKGFDMVYDEKCDILELCILAKLNFKPQSFNEGVEGYFGNIDVWKDGPKATEEADEYADLMDRLASRMDVHLYDKLRCRFPISKFVERPMALPNAPNTSGYVQRLLPMQTQSLSEDAKRRRIDPRNVIYQQNFSQSPSQNGTSAPRSTLVLAEAQVVSGRGSRISTSTSGSELGLSLPEHPWNATNTLSLDVLCRVNFHRLSDRTAFETQAIIADIDPRPEYIFVKPFGRTLKISPFRMVLAKANTRMTVEVPSEEELCKFFGIEEVEVAILLMGKLVKSLKKLLRKQTKIVVEKRVKTSASGHKLPYWALSSSLESLAHSPHRLNRF